MIRLLARIVVLLTMVEGAPAAEPALKVGVFAVDASPAVGSPLAYDPTKEVTWPLSCKGVVLLGKGEPIVLCAVDWIGIGNDGNKEFRKALAEAVGTTTERVAVHTLAPARRAALRLLGRSAACRLRDQQGGLRRGVRPRGDRPRRDGRPRGRRRPARPVTHMGLGEAKVEKVASNRRILGPDGKVKYVRYTSCKDPVIRDQPVGTIDPMLKMISFWDGDKPIVALTYYATHPQSYYRTGGANPDFPGMARDAREKATGVPHIHFDGAGGNIGAGKWNDGSHENRQILADRVAAGMAKAWKATTKEPITAADLGWKSMPVALPVAPHLDESKLQDDAREQDGPGPRAGRGGQRAGLAAPVSRPRHDRRRLPAAGASAGAAPARASCSSSTSSPPRRLRPDLFVALAAYGDYAPGYIGTEVAYPQGGYETGPAGLARGARRRARLDGCHQRGCSRTDTIPAKPLTGDALHSLS